MKKITSITLSVLSGILMALSFPNANLGFLAFFCLVPLFIVIYYLKSFKQVILFSYLTGLVFFNFTAYWLVFVSPWLLLITLYVGIYFPIFGCIVKSFFNSSKKSAFLFVILIPSAWAALEYIRGNILTGLGWVLLGYSQYLNLPLIQIADIGGAYAVSFFIVAINALIFIFIRNRFFKKDEVFFNISKAAIFVLCISLFTLLYGFFRLNEKSDEVKVKISVLQGNIPLEWYWDPADKAKDLILDKYIDLTKAAAKESPELIVWPETSVPEFLEADPRIHDVIKNLSKEVDIPLLVGSPTITLGAYAEKLYNSVILQKEGKEIERYNKLHLVPFGEYLPLERNLYFIRKIIPQPIGEYTPGSRYTIFPLKDDVCFGVVICFEDVFPGIVSKFVRTGADFMINSTNDEWFMESSAPYQHLQASVFRAVENRRSVVRAANTGVSSFIDPKGKIFAKVEDKNGKDIFVEGFKTAEISIIKRKSIYTAIGDLFAVISLILSIGYIITLFRKRP